LTSPTCSSSDRQDAERRTFSSKFLDLEDPLASELTT
jgi:hypothetical protein